MSSNTWRPLQGKPVTKWDKVDPKSLSCWNRTREGNIAECCLKRWYNRVVNMSLSERHRILKHRDTSQFLNLTVLMGIRKWKSSDLTLSGTDKRVSSEMIAFAALTVAILLMVCLWPNSNSTWRRIIYSHFKMSGHVVESKSTHCPSLRGA